MKKIAMTIACLLLAACNSTHDTTDTAHFNAPYAAVTDAAVASATGLGLYIAERQEVGTGTMLVCERKHDVLSHGGEVNIIVQPTASGTDVAIYTTRAVEIGSKPENFSSQLFAAIGRKVGE